MWNVWWCRCLVFLRIGQVLSLEAYTPAHDRPNGIAHINISEWRVSNHHPAATHTHTGERAAAESHVHPSQEVEDGTLRTITLFPPLSESTRHPEDRDGIELRVLNGGAYTGTKRGGWDEEGECTKYFRPPPFFASESTQVIVQQGCFFLSLFLQLWWPIESLKLNFSCYRFVILCMLGYTKWDSGLWQFFLPKRCQVPSTLMLNV